MRSADASSLLRRVAPGSIAMLIALAAASAQETRMLATVDNPATVPILPSPSAESANGGPSQVIVTVTGFQPSPAGPVQVVVEARCRAAQVEIGRFGILPQTAFSSADPAQTQRFGLTIAQDSTCTRPESVTIRLVPSYGDGRGATLEIGSVELR
jgi:hypothetical protein